MRFAAELGGAAEAPHTAAVTPMRQPDILSPLEAPVPNTVPRCSLSTMVTPPPIIGAPPGLRQERAASQLVTPEYQRQGDQNATAQTADATDTRNIL